MSGGENKFYEDVPNEHWLQEQIDYAKERGLDRFGSPYIGKVTGSFEHHVTLPVSLLASFKGQRKEQENVRGNDLQSIKEIMTGSGKLPLLDNGNEYVPFVVVAHDGTVRISEGNHRIMAADQLGWKELPVEIRYYDGGERIESGALHPSKLNSLKSDLEVKVEASKPLFQDEKDLPNTIGPSTRRMKIGDLPRDMREELFNEHATNSNPDATERGFYAKTVPYGLIYVSELLVDNIPKDQLTRYMEADLADLPPIVIADGRLTDGQHRILTAVAKGSEQLRYIDMTGLIDTEIGGYVSEIPKKYHGHGLQEKQAQKPAQLDSGYDFKTGEGAFTSYYWNGDKRQGEVTVEKAKAGFIIRNIFIPDDEQKKGIGTTIYAWVNELSMSATKNPLRSTQPRNLLDGKEVLELSEAGKGLWASLERNGFAIKESNGSYKCTGSFNPSLEESISIRSKVKP